MNVNGKLFFPELLAGLRPLEQMTSMPMPEAAMNKNHGVIFWKNEIWLAWQAFVVEPVSESLSE